MEDISIVYILFLIFSGAAILATLALSMRQSLIIAYIALGLIIGPWGLNILSDAGLIQNISNSARSQAEAATDLTATMQGIQEVTTQATAGTEKTSRSIGNLSRLAQDLDTSVAGFKLPQ